MRRSFQPAHKLRAPLVTLVLATASTFTTAVLVPTAAPVSAASAPVPVVTGARYPYPAKCPIGTTVAEAGNCLLDEGWSPIGPSVGCKITGLGGNHSMCPVPAQTTLSVSPLTVALSSTLYLRVSIAAPRCTFQTSNLQKRCWTGLYFGQRSTYLPQNSSSNYNPPLVRFNHACASIPWYSSYKGTSCTATLVPGLGSGRVLTDRYMVISVETAIAVGGLAGAVEIDIVEVAVGFGPQHKCGAPGGASCPLKVSVRALQPIRSGLALDTLDPSEGSVNFSVPSYAKSYSDPASLYGEPGEAAQECMSGCANLLVSVVDPKRNKPVKGASVTVSVGPVDFVKGGGHEFLCTNFDEPTKLRCGAESLSGLTTDPHGQLHLIYWAPSVMQVEKTTLTVSAQARGYPRAGTSATTLTIRPNVIYDKLADFSALDVRELIETYRDGGRLAIMNQYLEEPFEGVLDGGFDWLAGSEELAAAAFEGAAAALTTPLFVGIEAVHLSTEVLEQIKLIDVFLHELDLKPFGFERPSHESSANIRIPVAFNDYLLHGLFVPGHIRTGGLIWGFAQHLSFVMSPQRAHSQSLQLQIYEVSYCDQAEAAHCGPGYRTDDGIQAKLCFLFTTDDLSPNFLYQFCLDEYDPLAFVESQPGLIRESQPDLKGRFS
ncbi:MAG: hypothetical protein ACLQVK_20775 [Acidimicrobiales bacterium]